MVKVNKSEEFQQFVKERVSEQEFLSIFGERKDWNPDTNWYEISLTFNKLWKEFNGGEQNE